MRQVKNRNKQKDKGRVFTEKGKSEDLKEQLLELPWKGRQEETESHVPSSKPTLLDPTLKDTKNGWAILSFTYFLMRALAE